MTTPSQATRKRVVYQLDTPFSTIPWPTISQEDQDTILELLCDLLAPLGQYRQTYNKRSKGKRAAKRDRVAKRSNIDRSEPPVPPRPEISSQIDVGLNSIGRGLNGEDGTHRQYSMIFVTRGNQSSSFNCQFPLMVSAASKDLSLEDKIRLVGFSKSCSERLSTCLGVPRVSSVAIMGDAPGARALQEFVRKAVEPVDATWFDGTKDTKYLTTKINAIETTVGPKRQRLE